MGLVDGGDGVLIVETIFDTLNAKAALFAIGEYLEFAALDIPVAGGREWPYAVWSEALYAPSIHSKLMCVFPVKVQQMIPFVKRLAACAECFVHMHSNAGLPNASDGYGDTPEDMAKYKQQ